MAATAQSIERTSFDSAVSITQSFGQGAGDRPDMIVDVTAAARLGKGWVAYIRPWLRQSPTDPYDVAREIYQAAVQHERRGPVSTRIDLGYILSPIGIGMLDMRPDTNPLTLPHLSYLIPMPSFDPGAPGSMPIASSYPLGGVFTASTTRWDVRAAVTASPPNRAYVLNAAAPNPSPRPFAIVGGGITPRTGLRVALAYGAGEYAAREEFTRPATEGRQLRMVSVEGEFAFAYTKITGELTRDTLTTDGADVHATQWFVQGVQTLAPRWFVAGRHEGANAPASPFFAFRPALRLSEAVIGYRLSPDLLVKNGINTRKTYYSQTSDRQYTVSLVWARRWK
jgi:hypothetical protein